MTASLSVPRYAVAMLGRVSALCVLGMAFHAAAVESLAVRVHRTFPHDPSAFTQGLLWWQGKLYESTGRRGKSELRRIDPDTGTVEHRVRIPVLFFGEGLARAGQRLVMLTWKANQALEFGLPDLHRLGTLSYRGEGWGLCHDGDRFIMSDGSEVLSFRDSESFALLGRISVTFEGSPFANLNELECVHGAVYANVFQRDIIVRIDPVTGRVTARVDATGLRVAAQAEGADVLNGIAYAPELDRFFVTGKLWPAMFEVAFVDESGQTPPMDQRTGVED
ncbi:MAG: glutaminyl-peptide cyclotransferase [Gammaproteobacteria bacterium]|nr:glutaminyl-peptide cyclotransferase [Gammaproteobacteria bacterium]